jgi:sulfoxide reductase heme-binding subunit YedZ
MPPRSLPWWKPTTKTGLHLLLALPVLFLVLRGALEFQGIDFMGGLGVNPIEAVIRNLGDWALRILILALAVTPVRRLTGWPQIARYRRMIGLWAFAYVTMHLLCYVVLDQFFDWASIWKMIVKSKFILVGMLAFALLLPLAVTSTNGMIRRLGAARWRRLHKLAYVAGVCGAIHYIWMVKADITQPMIYMVILLTLLAMRVWWWNQSRPRLAAPPAVGRAG